ncbi:MAG: ATP-binding cassette domain-containing protein [Myxococcota bacterium]
MIETRELRKRYGEVEALAGLDLVAHDGCVTGLLGPNGAGKTTALRCIYGLVQPDGGWARVDDHRTDRNPLEARRALGVFTDKFGLYDRLTVREQIDYFAQLNGADRAAARRATEEVIERLELGALAGRRSEGFSQGERMKVGLARALVKSPTTLVLDEPTRGLDVMSARNLRRLLRELAGEGRCILFSSHVMAEVASVCDRVVVVRAGQALAEGTPAELCARAGETELEEAFIKLIGSGEGLAA